MDEASDPRIGVSRAVPDAQRDPINPYFVILWIVMAGCAIAGFILLSTGSNIAANAFEEPGAGIAQIVWGGALLGLAVTTAIVMLGAAAARWRNDE